MTTVGRLISSLSEFGCDARCIYYSQVSTKEHGRLTQKSRGRWGMPISEQRRHLAKLAPIVGVAESAQTAMIKNDPNETALLLRSRHTFSREQTFPKLSCSFNRRR